MLEYKHGSHTHFDIITFSHQSKMSNLSVPTFHLLVVDLQELEINALTVLG